MCVLVREDTPRCRKYMCTPALVCVSQPRVVCNCEKSMEPYKQYMYDDL